MQLTYKPFIDGLRAIAVIVVIIFHTNPSFLPGGYLGVDIFFVISGFVISQSLYKYYLQTGEIKIKDFYIRRLKRLYPALLLMVVVTTFLYAFFGFQWDVNLYLKSAVTSVLAVSNLYFLYRGTDYFHQDLVNPLLHTWSLGVEEQFYFFYPFLLAILFFLLKRHLASLNTVTIAVASVSVSSFVIFLFDFGLISDFYSPFARFWEIGLGCFIFFLLQTKNKIKNSYFLISIMLIVIPILGSEYIENLRLDVLMVVAGTGTLIISGLTQENHKVINILVNPLITYIGKISYSLYLWHLPVLYFAFLYLEGVTFYTVVFLGTLTTAALSYHFVEKPIRYSSSVEGVFKKMFNVAPYGATVLIFCTLLISPSDVRAWANGTFNQIGKQLESVNYIENKFSLGDRIMPAYTLGNQSAVQCSDTEKLKKYDQNELGIYDFCLRSGEGTDLYYLTGDSHAFHFLSMFDRAENVSNLYFTEENRQNLVNKSPDNFDVVSSKNFFNEMDARLQSLGQEYENVYLFTSYYLSLHQEQVEQIGDMLEQYVEQFGEYATLVFIAPTPVFPNGPESCVLLKKHCEIDRETDLMRRQTVYSLLLSLAEKNDNVYVYDPYYQICPEKTCINYVHQNDFLNYIDKDHLSPELSSKLSAHFDGWIRENLHGN